MKTIFEESKYDIKKKYSKTYIKMRWWKYINKCK